MRDSGLKRPKGLALLKISASVKTINPIYSLMTMRLRVFTKSKLG